MSEFAEETARDPEKKIEVEQSHLTEKDHASGGLSVDNDEASNLAENQLSGNEITKDSAAHEEINDTDLEVRDKDGDSTIKETADVEFERGQSVAEDVLIDEAENSSHVINSTEILEAIDEKKDAYDKNSDSNSIENTSENVLIADAENPSSVVDATERRQAKDDKSAEDILIAAAENSTHSNDSTDDLDSKKCKADEYENNSDPQPIQNHEKATYSSKNSEVRTESEEANVEKSNSIADENQKVCGEGKEENSTNENTQNPTVSFDRNVKSTSSNEIKEEVSNSSTNPPQESSDDTQNFKLIDDDHIDAKKIIQDLVLSEMSYVDYRLKFLSLDISQFLQASSQQKEFIFSRVLTPSEISLVFYNVNALLSFHTKILDAFLDLHLTLDFASSSIDDWILSLSKKMKPLIPFFKLYTPYIVNLGQSMQVYLRQLDFVVEFEEFILTCNQAFEMNVEETLFSPVSRLPQYLQYFGALYKRATSEETKDCLREIIVEIVQIFTEAMAKFRQQLQKNEVLTLQEEFGGKVSLVSPSRYVVKIGEVLRVHPIRSPKKLKPCKFVLFNDIVLVGSKTRRFLRGRIKTIYDLSKLRAVEVPDGTYENIVNAFKLVRSGVDMDPYVLICKHPDERASWIKLVNAEAEAFEELCAVQEMGLFPKDPNQTLAESNFTDLNSDSGDLERKSSDSMISDEFSPSGVSSVDPAMNAVAEDSPPDDYSKPKDIGSLHPSSGIVELCKLTLKNYEQFIKKDWVPSLVHYEHTQN